ncbi:hypothetical protein [Micromonospora sp. NPDC048898]|uniref:hypothetical protein n=1 Tax=Micromonospora sp. NPDC048898 TaxID=3364260 RepID=UPI0037182716
MRLTAIVTSAVLAFSALVGGIVVSAGTQPPASSQQSTVADPPDPNVVQTPVVTPTDNNGNG